MGVKPTKTAKAIMENITRYVLICILYINISTRSSYSISCNILGPKDDAVLAIHFISGDVLKILRHQ